MTLHLRLEPRHLYWLLGGLIGVELLLLGVYVATAMSGSPSHLGLLFDLNEEANVPAWFSSMQLFLIGLVLLLALANPLRDRDHLRGLLWVLGGGFIFLSMDESAAFHEKVTTVMSRFEWAPRFSDGHGIWMFVYVAIGLAIVAALFRPILQVCRCYPRDVVGVGLGIGVLVGGAVGVEAIGYETIDGQSALGVKTLQVAAEEFLEMLGASIVLVAAVRFALRERIPVPSRLLSGSISPVSAHAGGAGIRRAR